MVLSIQYEGPIGRFRPKEENILWGRVGGGAIMSIATEILSRRRDQFSSVARLIAAWGWERATHEPILLRRYAVSTGSGDDLAECKQLLLPRRRANRRRFVELVASCNFLRKARRSNPAELHPA